MNILLNCYTFEFELGLLQTNMSDLTKYTSDHECITNYDEEG